MLKQSIVTDESVELTNRNQDLWQLVAMTNYARRRYGEEIPALPANSQRRIAHYSSGGFAERLRELKSRRQEIAERIRTLRARRIKASQTLHIN